MRMRRFLCAVTLLCLAVSGLSGLLSTASASPKYYITVDITNQIVTVYDNDNRSESGIARQMICSTGKSGTATPTGTYTLPYKTYSSERQEWYYFSKYNCYAKYATRIIGGILFHSVLYTASKRGPTSSSVNALGSKASHGCVRLRVADAKWIAQNCLAGTQCRIYYSGKSNSSLRKKLLKKSFSRSSETYDHFMGRKGKDEGFTTLSKGSRGDDVKQLQSRLKALGFLDDSADGKFGANTQTAVKNFQAACGLKKTGKVNESLWKRAFANDAPTGTYVTLTRGQSGPAVKALQEALIALKLYDGAADGVYGDMTVEAVLAYQRCFGFTLTGKAGSALQQDALARASGLKEDFPDGDYRLVTDDEEVSLAKITGTSSATLRSKASTGGKSLGKIKKNTELLVLSAGDSWTKVQYDGKAGYIQNKYLEFYTGTRTTARYESGPEPTPTPTPTPEISLPTPTPTPTPEIALPTPTPTPTPEATLPGQSPNPSPTPWDLVLAAPAEMDVSEVELAVPEVAMQLCEQPATGEETTGEETTGDVPADATGAADVNGNRGGVDAAATGDAPADAVDTGDTPADAAGTGEAPADAAGTGEAPADAASTGEVPADAAATDDVPADAGEPSPLGVRTPGNLSGGQISERTGRQTLGTVDQPDAEPDEVPVDAADTGDTPVDATAASDVNDATPLPRCAVALAGGAKLYALPEADEAALLAELPEGASAEVVGLEGDWIAVRFEEGVAYLPAAAARLTDEAPEPLFTQPQSPAVEPGGETAPEIAAPEPLDDTGLTGEVEELVPEETGEVELE